MTLLSGSLLSVPLFECFPRASQQALDRVFARCVGDPSCHGTFPHLAAEWARLRASVADRPVTLPAPMSPTGAAIRLDSDGLAAEVHQLLMMSAGTAAYVPLLIHSLAVARDKRAAVAMIARLLTAPGQAHGIDPGPWQQCDAGIVRAFVEHASTMRLNTSCLSDVPLPAFPVHW